MALETQVKARSSQRMTAVDAILPLEPGDRLDRVEFERRFRATPHLKKAELIEGVVHMSPPVSLDGHAEPHFHLLGLFYLYQASTPGVRGADNASIRLDAHNMPQPDLALFIDPQRGGQARISDDGYLEAAPELVAEIASSSASLDLHAKLRMYERHGVREYIVWRVRERALDWFVRRESGFERVALDEQGVIQSVSFPGLWLDTAALLADDGARLQATLHAGLASAPHAEFRARLEAASRS